MTYLPDVNVWLALAILEHTHHSAAKRWLETAENDIIAFNAGSHTEVIKLAFNDFERLVHPNVLSFTT